MQNEKKLVMAGCLDAGWEIIQFLLENGIRFSYFVSLTPEQAIQYSVSGYKSFEGLALKYDIPIYYPKSYNLKHRDDLAFFAKHQFDLLVQGGWQRLFSEDLSKTLKTGAIGLHGSPRPLPFGRGRSSVNWSIIQGETQFIMHYFLIKPGVDDGDVFHTTTFDITPWDTCKTIFYKYSIASKYAFLEWIPKLLAGDVPVKPQIGEASYYPKRTPADGVISWSSDTNTIHNLVRGVTKPYPGAFTFLNGHKLLIWKAQPFDYKLSYADAANGEIVECFASGDFIVKTVDGLLLVTEYEGVPHQHIQTGARLQNN
jgi:methionyl-tRNA formyltransferase